MFCIMVSITCYQSHCWCYWSWSMPDCICRKYFMNNKGYTDAMICHVLYAQTDSLWKELAFKRMAVAFWDSVFPEKLFSESPWHLAQILKVHTWCLQINATLQRASPLCLEQGLPKQWNEQKQKSTYSSYSLQWNNPSNFSVVDISAL